MATPYLFHQTPLRLATWHSTPTQALDETQQTTGKTAEDAVEDLLDGEEKTVDHLVEADDKAAQGEDQRSQVDQDTSYL
jgi:hypothetical protein